MIDVKCPFRTKKIIKPTYHDNPFNVTYGKIRETTVETTFEECLGTECPYYGRNMIDLSTGKTHLSDECRRAE